jgi:hypothetical protein
MGSPESRFHAEPERFHGENLTVKDGKVNRRFVGSWQLEFEKSGMIRMEREVS